MLTSKLNFIKSSKVLIGFAAFLLLLLSFGCASKKQAIDNEKIRLGYLLNIAHAVPMVGLESNAFTDTQSQYFFSGGHLINSLITGNLDMAYVGPGPLLNALSKGVKLKILGISSYGANSFVISREYVKDFYESVSDSDAVCMITKLDKLAVPQLGNTQDLLLRLLLSKINPANSESLLLRNFSPSLEIIAVNPAELETVFFTKSVDAALVQEPWATILESRGAKLVDDPAIDEINKYPAAILVVSEEFYASNKDKVDRYYAEQNKVLKKIIASRSYALDMIAKHFRSTVAKELDRAILEKSLAKLSFSSDSGNEVFSDLIKVARDAKYFNDLKLSRINIEGALAK